MENENIDALIKENELLQKRLNELNQQEETNGLAEINENKLNVKTTKNANKGKKYESRIELTSKANDDLKQKQKKNYILDNKNKIQEIQPKQIKGEDHSATHKNFGKVPE